MPCKSDEKTGARHLADACKSQSVNAWRTGEHDGRPSDRTSCAPSCEVQRVRKPAFFKMAPRSGLAPDAALRLIRAQTSRRNRLQAADDVLVNAGTREDFACRVRHYALRLWGAAEKHLL